MKVSPVATPAASSQPSPQQGAPSARDRAISALMGSQPVQNANSVQPEEMTAIKAPSGQHDTSVELEANTDEVEAVEEPQKPSPEEEALAKQYETLKRQEKALRMKAQSREQALKQREEQLAAREQALSAKDQEYSQGYINKAKLQSMPLETLAELGLTYEELTQRQLNQLQSNPVYDAQIQELKAEIKRLAQASEDGTKRQTEAQQQAYESAVNQIRFDAKTLVSQNPDFELTKAWGKVDDVVELITKTYDEDGTLLTVEEAAREVEAYLEEEASKLTRIEKIKKKLGLAQADVQKAEPKAVTSNTQQKQPMKTLTNANSSTRPLSARERAIMAMEGKLNKG